MKNKLYLLIVLLICLAGLSSCKKNGPSPITTQPGGTGNTGGTGGTPPGNTQVKPGDIFISGYEYSGLGNGVAEYWKNGAVTALTDGTTHAQANAIALSGDDVYVVGFQTINNVKVAKCWKNGIATSLTDGTYEANAFGVCVSGSDVYVCGYEMNAGKIALAKYWKNGVAVSLPLEQFQTGAQAYDIKVIGTDVYVAGSVSAPGMFYDLEVPKYWKNGNAVNLGTKQSDYSGTAFSIAIAGQDIYLAGGEIPYSHVGIPNALYWGDGIRHLLSDERYGGWAVSVCLNNGNVYSAGFANAKTGISYACYWKNGDSALYFTDGTYYAGARGIAIAGSDIYGVGYELTNGNYSVPRCWKNNTVIPLASIPSGYNGEATGIVIAK